MIQHCYTVFSRVVVFILLFIEIPLWDTFFHLCTHLQGSCFLENKMFLMLIVYECIKQTVHEQVDFPANIMFPS